MGRTVLRYNGKGPAPREEIERIRHLPGVQVVDDASSPRMLLVEITGEAARELASSFSSWMVVPEKTVPLPDTRQRAQRRSGHRPRSRRGP